MNMIPVSDKELEVTITVVAKEVTSIGPGKLVVETTTSVVTDLLTRMQLETLFDTIEPKAVIES